MVSRKCIENAEQPPDEIQTYYLHLPLNTDFRKYITCKAGCRDNAQANHYGHRYGQDFWREKSPAHEIENSANGGKIPQMHWGIPVHQSHAKYLTPTCNLKEIAQMLPLPLFSTPYDPMNDRTKNLPSRLDQIPENAAKHVEHTAKSSNLGAHGEPQKQAKSCF